MMRTRLDRRGTVDYQVARDNNVWRDHQARTLVTGALLAWLKPNSVLDPACGDGSIVRAANDLFPIHSAHLTDISVPSIERIRNWLPYGWTADALPANAPLLEQTAWHWDAIILTEFLEHIEDPDAILRLAREQGRYLVASSPEMRDGQVDDNPEHLWMFDRTGYMEMLKGAGWTVQQYTHLNFRTQYDFGIWVCS